MHDKPPFTDPGNEIYYQCLDIVLDNHGPDLLTLMGGPGTPDAGPVDPNTPDADPGNPANPDAGGSVDPVGGGDGACGCQSSGSGGGTLLVLLAAALWWRRPRRV